MVSDIFTVVLLAIVTYVLLDIVQTTMMRRIILNIGGPGVTPKPTYKPTKKVRLPKKQPNLYNQPGASGKIVDPVKLGTINPSIDADSSIANPF